MIFLFAVLFAGLVASCNDLLDLQNDGRTTIEEVFKTRNGVRGYLNSCYGYLPVAGIGRSSLTDDAQDADGIYGNSLYSYWYANGFSASFFFATDEQPWSSYYEGIRKCNMFIGNMPGVDRESIGASEAEMTTWVAQAYSLRALYYLQLIKRYGAVPIITETYDITHDYSDDRRAPVSEVVGQILADCDAALSAPAIANGFSWRVSAGQRGIMTRAVVNAIRSEAITYAVSPLFDDGTYTWADATRINGEALSGCLSNGFELFRDEPAPDIAQNAYALYFITRSDEQQAYDKETIYGGQTLSVWQTAGMPSTAGQITAGPCPTQELVDSYEMQATGERPVTGYSDAAHLQPVINPSSGYNPDRPYEGRDPRFYASIYYNGAPRRLDGNATVGTYFGAQDGITATDRRTTRTGYYLRKYNNWRSSRDNSADGEIRLFRLGALYLNFAESAYQSAGPDAAVNLGNGISMSARDAVNAIRTRAGMPLFPAGMTREAFEAKYRNERRVELAFEEHRYFDVRRWKILESSERYLTGMYITQQENGGFSYERIGFERASGIEKYYFYPIEQSEANKMQDHTGVNWQNPGWN
ncbi:MAG: RagB/SusD family nutrient uptake outer membrane protein [Tannerella sp.]|nr:RagB/SusD family nutrient uptake outer membrane protein [Tannerella sp.]